MRPLIPAALSVLALSACDPQSLAYLTRSIQEAQSVCPAQSPGNCAFVNSPVRTGTQSVTLPRRPYPFFKTSENLEFVDALGRRWVAPRNTLTDGASIPPIFVSIIGNPREPQFANAAAVHDAYCGVGNEQGPVFHDGKWQDVHRMFYDALIAGGTARPRAGLMFAAVYLGGPRWNLAYEKDLTNVPARAKQASLRRVKSYIEREDPPFDRLLRRLLQEERVLLSTQLPRRNEGETETRGIDTEDPYDPGYEYPIFEPDPGYPGADGPIYPYPDTSETYTESETTPILYLTTSN